MGSRKRRKRNCPGPSWGRTAWSSAVPGDCHGGRQTRKLPRLKSDEKIATGRAGARRCSALPGELPLGRQKKLPRAEYHSAIRAPNSAHHWWGGSPLPGRGSPARYPNPTAWTARSGWGAGGGEWMARRRTNVIRPHDQASWRIKAKPTDALFSRMASVACITMGSR